MQRYGWWPLAVWAVLCLGCEEYIASRLAGPGDPPVEHEACEVQVGSMSPGGVRSEVCLDRPVGLRLRTQSGCVLDASVDDRDRGGGDVPAEPLPHHRAYGSRTRRFGRLRSPNQLGEAQPVEVAVREAGMRCRPGCLPPPTVQRRDASRVSV